MKRKLWGKVFYVTVFLILILFGSLWSETNVQKLELNLSELTGIERIKTLSILAKFYCRTDPEKAIKFGKEALSLSEKNPDAMIKASIFLSIAWSYCNIGQYDKALLFIDKSFGLTKKSGDEQKMAQSLNLKGIISFYRAKYADALGFFLKALKIFKKYGNKREIASTLNSIGIVYDMTENYESALGYYFQSLKVKKELGDLKLIASTLNNIGVIFNITDFPKKAIRYFEEALKINRDLKRDKSIAITLTNIGNLYYAGKNFKKALSYYNEALPYDEKRGNLRGMASLYNNIGLSLFGMGRFDESMRYYRKSLGIRQRLGDEKFIIRTMQNIAAVNFKKGNYKRAENELKLILKKALKINARKELLLVYKSLYEIYEKNRDLEKAFFYLKKYEKLNGEILNEKSREKVLKLENRFLLKNREKEIELLKKDRVIQRIKIKKQKFTAKVFIIGSLLLFTGVVFLLYLYREKSKINKKLKVLNRVLDRSARTDPLTGASNRRDIYEKIKYEFDRISRTKKSFSLVICDIDDFKSFNDNYGHDCGDFILKMLTVYIRSLLRKQDALGRWGGEEFIFILPETTSEGAVVLSEKIRKSVSEKVFEFNGLKLSVTLTLGVCELSKGMDIRECLKKADEALYSGKKKGKNQVHI